MQKDVLEVLVRIVATNALFILLNSDLAIDQMFHFENLKKTFRRVQ